jgi:hypothetical protein
MQWFSIAVDAAFSMVLAGLPFLTAAAMLALIPLIVVATWLGAWNIYWSPGRPDSQKGVIPFNTWILNLFFKI